MDTHPGPPAESGSRAGPALPPRRRSRRAGRCRPPQPNLRSRRTRRGWTPLSFANPFPACARLRAGPPVVRRSSLSDASLPSSRAPPASPDPPQGGGAWTNDREPQRSARLPVEGLRRVFSWGRGPRRPSRSPLPAESRGPRRPHATRTLRRLAGKGFRAPPCEPAHRPRSRAARGTCRARRRRPVGHVNGAAVHPSLARTSVAPISGAELPPGHCRRRGPARTERDAATDLFALPTLDAACRRPPSASAHAGISDDRPAARAPASLVLRRREARERQHELHHLDLPRNPELGEHVLDVRGHAHTRQSKGSAARAATAAASSTQGARRTIPASRTARWTATV